MGYNSSLTAITLSYASGTITLNGGVFESASGTTAFTNVGGGTANFGVASTFPTFS